MLFNLCLYDKKNNNLTISYLNQDNHDLETKIWINSYVSPEPSVDLRGNEVDEDKNSEEENYFTEAFKVVLQNNPDFTKILLSKLAEAEKNKDPPFSYLFLICRYFSVCHTSIYSYMDFWFFGYSNHFNCQYDNSTSLSNGGDFRIGYLIS